MGFKLAVGRNIRSGAALYVAGQKLPAIVCAMHVNDAGIYYEETARMVSEWRNPGVLGAAIAQAIALCSPKDKNLRDTNKSDWPAYKASGCKTMKAFEQGYSRIDIGAVNDANLVFRACVMPRKEGEIEFCVSFGSNDEPAKIGNLLVRLADAAGRWPA